MRCAPDMVPMVGELLDSQFVNVVGSYSVTCSFTPTWIWVRFSSEGEDVTKEEVTSEPEIMSRLNTELYEKQTI